MRYVRRASLRFPVLIINVCINVCINVFLFQKKENYPNFVSRVRVQNFEFHFECFVADIFVFIENQYQLPIIKRVEIN